MLAGRQRHPHRMQAAHEVAGFPERVEHGPAHPGHDAHVDRDVGGIAEFDANMGNGGTQRPHAEGDHIQRAPTHAAVEHSAKGNLHFRRGYPVIGRAGVVFVHAANEGAVLDPGDIAGIGEGQIAVRALGLVEFGEGAGFHHLGTQPIVFFLGTVAPGDTFRLRECCDFSHPLAQLLIFYVARIHRLHLFNFLHVCLVSHDCHSIVD